MILNKSEVRTLIGSVEYLTWEIIDRIPEASLADLVSVPEALERLAVIRGKLRTLHESSPES